MNKLTEFSLIIPTFTGAETIASCFDSILNQNNLLDFNFEVIVVIDGPNKQLEDICVEYKSIFEKREITFILHQLKKNQGRFNARLTGTKLAKHKNLLFLDDRITFSNDYFHKITNTNQEVVIPNVMETDSKNYISRCLYLLRRQVYGKKKFGTKFKSYFITTENFESSPKGTTSLWVSKKTFILACNDLDVTNDSGKFTNEDTKLFKAMLNRGNKLYKDSSSIIYYQPRSGTWDELRHLYHRGPRFVDYYNKPGTRYFIPLILGSITSILIFILTVVFFKSVGIIELMAIIAFLIVLALRVSENHNDWIKVIFGVPLITLAFALGVYKGIVLWFKTVLMHSEGKPK